jgi:hypothetical protein
MLVRSGRDGGAAGSRSQSAAPITIDYPTDRSIFPPELPPPTFLWRDAEAGATHWRIEVEFAGGAPRLQVKSSGERLQVGEIDPRCVGAVPPTSRRNKPRRIPGSPIPRRGRPSRTVPRPAPPRSPSPDSRTRANPAPFRAAASPSTTSEDPVGAPIFYRDVPLIPSPTVKGVIKPLPPFAIGLIEWRLRNVGETQSKIVMQGLPTCANCHSFSLDGKTFGLDVDGPQNDKGLYALVPVRKEMSIRNEDVIRWSSFRGAAPVKTDGPAAKRFGFMSQVSPDGQYVVTTIDDPSGRGVQNVERPGARAGGPLLQRGLQGLRLRAGFLSDARHPGLVQPRGGATATAARRRRSALCAGQCGVESRRPVPGVCQSGGQGSVSAGKEGVGVRQQSGRDADSV